MRGETVKFMGTIITDYTVSRIKRQKLAEVMKFYSCKFMESALYSVLATPCWLEAMSRGTVNLTQATVSFLEWKTRAKIDKTAEGNRRSFGTISNVVLEKKM
jgi:hypothetical protein